MKMIQNGKFMHNLLAFKCESKIKKEKKMNKPLKKGKIEIYCFFLKLFIEFGHEFGKLDS